MGTLRSPLISVAVQEGTVLQQTGVGASDCLLSRPPHGAPVLASPTNLRGRSADGSHGGGLLRVVRCFIHNDFNVIIPGKKKGKRPHVTLLNRSAVRGLFCKCQHYFLGTHSLRDVTATAYVTLL